MAHSQWIEAIQERVDGTLGRIRDAELQQHLDVCPECRALLKDLEKLRDAASSLDVQRPPDHVWLQIAGRLRQEGRVHDRPSDKTSARLQYAWLAIAATLVLAVGAALLVVFMRTTPNGNAPSTAAEGNAGGGDAVQSGVEELRQAAKLLQSSIAKLKEGMGSDQQALLEQTSRTLEQNLQTLDQAIADRTAWVRQDPQNAAARTSLFDALQQKISLLQDTITLMNEMRKGNGAGATHVVEGTNKS